MNELTPAEILNDLVTRYEGTIAVDAWGETSLFYNPGHVLPRGVYFATIKEKDGANDSASKLDRDGVFRLNAGTSKPLFMETFGPPPRRPGKGGIVDGPWDIPPRYQLPTHPFCGRFSRLHVASLTHETLGEPWALA